MLRWFTVFVMAMLLQPFFVDAQGGSFVLTGKVVDDQTGDPLVGVSVYVRSTRMGGMTDLNGIFEVKQVVYGEYSLDFTYIGYETYTLNVTLKDHIQVDVGEIRMKSSDIGIEEVQVIASISDGRSPVASTTLSEADILERRAPGLDYPELVRFSPSVYVSRAGGGYGDSRISIRGFDQENLAVLLNGVPVNDMEFGNIFWVNWSGLDAVTRTTQIQRGLGVSKLAVNSVGGTMNIITKTTDQKAGGRVGYEASFAATDIDLPTGYGSDNPTSFPDTSKPGSLSPYLHRLNFLLSTGLLDGGWAFTFQGYRVWGDGYFEQQYVDFWSYFLSISKQLGDKHLLVFTAVGSPQEHGENLAPQTDSVWNERGYRYSPNWGIRDNGEYERLGNFYHKPQVALNHYWDISKTLNLNTSTYYSYGTGGGSFIPFGPKTTHGYWDVALMQQINQGTPDTTLTTSSGQVVTGTPTNFWITDFRLDQFWTGLISTLDFHPSEKFEYIFGLDLRYFEGDQFFEVNDLLGGDFLIDGSSVREPVRAVGVGDQIFQSKLSQIGWMGAFGQVEYKVSRFTAFLSASYIRNNYRRQDRFLYQENQGDVSDWVEYSNFSIKGGGRYFLTDEHAIFASAGFFTRAPFFGVVFGNDNVPDDIPNEKIISAEIGYEMRMRNFRASVNGYITTYSDKSLNVERFVNPVDGLEYAALISSIGGTHIGVEGDINWFPSPRLSLGGFFSFGNWILNGDAEGILLDFSRQIVGQATLYYDGLYVGNSAQTVLGGEATFRYNDRLNVRLSMVYYDRLYAEVGNRFDPNDTEQPYLLPAYYLVDLNAMYTFPFGEKLKGEFKLGFNNLLDRRYYSQGNDAVNHDLTDTGLFTGMGRTMSMGFAVLF